MSASKEPTAGGSLKTVNDNVSGSETQADINGSKNRVDPQYEILRYWSHELRHIFSIGRSSIISRSTGACNVINVDITAVFFLPL